jgi:biotin operon repressor
MTWLNDRLAETAIPVMIGARAMEYVPLLPPVWIDEPTARLTPTQQRILDHLKARAPASVSGFELRDEVSPNATEGNIRVQVNKMRKAGVEIASRSGVGGGYRLEEVA